METKKLDCSFRLQDTCTFIGGTCNNTECNIKAINKDEIKCNYFYSEGYIYKGTETICKMYGTKEEKESAAKLFLNQSPDLTKTL